MTRRISLAVLTFAAFAFTAVPAGAHEGAASVDCDRAVFGAIGFGAGEHTVGAVLTVTADDVPALVDLAPQTFDGDSGTVTWDVAEHTDRPGLLDLLLDVSWDAHGGGTTTATATVVCVEPPTTTTPKSPPTTPKPTTTTTGPPVTAATTSVPTTTTPAVAVPPAVDDTGPPELPRTGGPLVPLTVGALIVAVGALGLALGRRGRT